MRIVSIAFILIAFLMTLAERQKKGGLQRQQSLRESRQKTRSEAENTMQRTERNKKPRNMHTI